MSGTTISTPSSSASGNIRPPSMTMMSSPQRTAMQFIPNSPRPPRGTMCNFPVGMRCIDRSTRSSAGILPAVPRASRPRWCGRDAPTTAAGTAALPNPARAGAPAPHNKRNLPHWPSSAIWLGFMAEAERKTWLRRRVEAGLSRGFQRAYETVKVDPSKFLLQVRAAYGLPISNFQGVYSVEVGQLDNLAHRVIRSGMKVAAAEGAGFGLGGLMTIIPDMGILSGVTLRTIQKLSLIYGFEFNTEEETAELWIAAATAAGVDISRELLEKEVVSRFVPRVIQRIAAQASREVVEKWSGRIIPLASSVIGAGLNYYFVRAWGERARSHFRKRHMEIRGRMDKEKLIAVSNPPRALPS